MSATTYTPWEQFDSFEYVQRNYGNMIPEDRLIIQALGSEFLSFQLDKKHIAHAVDVGTGPNLYPAMIVAPFVQHIDLLEYSPNNVQYLENVLGAAPGEAYIAQVSLWREYSDKINELAVKGLRKTSITEVQKKAAIVKGSVWDLAENKYDLLTSFFVADSISDNMDEVIRALQVQIKSLRSGGIFIIAHVLETNGYYAGLGTSFPAVFLTKERVRSIYYRFAGIKHFHVHSFLHQEGEAKAREGYSGLALCVGEVN